MSQPPRFVRRLAVTLATSALAVASGVVALTVGAPAQPAAAAACNGYVALTYDDGPNPGTTTALLNALRSAGARATFFNMGQRVQQNAALARAQRDAGMWVENHSWSHPHMTQLSQQQMASEISQTQQAIQQATGVTPRLFRPPYGETNATLRSVQAQYGLTEVLWSVDSQDWNGASTAQIVQAANNLQDGGVILMHDGYQSTINAVSQIVANLSNRNLCPGMISPTTGRAVAPDGGPNNPPTTPPGNPPTTPPGNPPTTPPAGNAGCTASYRTIGSWGGGFQAEVTITNSGNSTLNGWTVRWTWPGGQTISNLWNGQLSQSGSSVTVRNVGHNGTVQPRQSTSFGFVGGGSSATPSVTCSSP
ncbi:polysaccharide deacetylase family protein [Plantactinospora sp. B24E8]|uniref:polysaccharide deacetylase family protein n=1 Tax=Plantactinospora sp. B24E8 TaxID=3153567 RepID=UPI00325EB111